MVNLNSVEGIESLIEKRTKPLKKQIKELTKLVNEYLEAINYTHSCKSDSEQLPKRLSASAYTQAMSGNYEEFVKWWDSKY